MLKTDRLNRNKGYQILNLRWRRMAYGHEHESNRKFSYGGLIRRGTRPGACGEATGRWRQIPRLAPACGRDPGTTSPPPLLVLRRPRWVWTLEAFARGPLLRSSHRGPSCLLFPWQMRGFLGSWPILRWAKEMALLVVVAHDGLNTNQSVA